MNLQTNRYGEAVCSRWNVRAARIVPVAAILLLASMIAAASCDAQTPPSSIPEPVDHAAFVNLAAINQADSIHFAGVNFSGSTAPAEVNRQESSSSALPDAPSAMLREEMLHASVPAVVVPGAPHVAPIHMKFIPAGWVAQPLTARDKAILGARNLYSPFSITGYVASAGYSHLTNRQPNYGTNSDAFAKRLGATVLRDTTEGAFTDMVFAPLLHEDPRYYVEGRRHGYVHRILYAITRPLITRTDSGRTTVNGALLAGQASASALSYTYYPQINRNFHDTFATFGGSLAGSAIDDVISEFSGQFLKELHLQRLKDSK